MNKMEYQKPWAEFVQFENEDVITASGQPAKGCEGNLGCSGGCTTELIGGLGPCICGIHDGYEGPDGKWHHYECVVGPFLGHAVNSLSLEDEDWSDEPASDFGSDTEDWSN